MNLNRLLRQAQAAYRHPCDTASFGLVYGQLTAAFAPLIQWAHSCWEYLLAQKGCRFVARSLHEKAYCRGDYRAFTERDFERLVHSAFRSVAEEYLKERVANNGRPTALSFESALRLRFWPKIVECYEALENPPDPNQRKLTGYSYLRCIPYQFLNPYHHRRVYAAIQRLPKPLMDVIELYHLRFFKEEAVAKRLNLSIPTLHQRLKNGLRTIASEDFLSFVLLKQIERY
jgi:hypothetical protein